MVLAGRIHASRQRLIERLFVKQKSLSLNLCLCTFASLFSLAAVTANNATFSARRAVVEGVLESAHQRAAVHVADHRHVWHPFTQMQEYFGLPSLAIAAGRGGWLIDTEGREYLDKKCRLSTYELADRLVYAKQRIPFVQANLIEMRHDDPAEVERWRQYVISKGVWANQPVPLFPYPGSPDYTRLWGPPDDLAWERAHEFYLHGYASFSDIQESRPVPLVSLELASHGRK